MQAMRTRIFKNGSSMAVRLPKEFRLEAGEATIRREGGNIIITPRQRTIGDLLDALSEIGPLSDDFTTDGPLGEDVPRLELD